MRREGDASECLPVREPIADEESIFPFGAGGKQRHGAPISSSTWRMYLMAVAGSSAQDRAPRVVSTPLRERSKNVNLTPG